MAEVSCKIEHLSASELTRNGVNLVSDSDIYRYTPNIEKKLIIQQRVNPLEQILVDLRTKLIGGASGYKVVKTDSYFSQEICCNSIDNTFRIAPAGAVSAVGGTVTVTINSTYSQNGKYSLPMIGHEIMFNKNGMPQKALIIAKSDATASAHTITLQANSGQVLDFTTAGNGGALQFQLVYNNAKPFNWECLTGEHLVRTQSKLVKNTMRSASKTVKIFGKQINGMGYNTVPNGGMEIFDFYDEASNKVIKTGFNWKSSAVTEVEQAKTMDITSNLLFNVQDIAGNKEFNGLYTTAKKGLFSGKGKFSDAKILSAHLTKLARMAVMGGFTGEFLMLHDIEFGTDVNSAMNQIARENDVYNSGALGGRIVNGDLVWESMKTIKNFKNTGIDFTFKQVAFDGIKDFTTMASNFCIVMPMMNFKDQDGNVVPPIELTRPIAYDEKAGDRMWINDTRDLQCQDIFVNAIWHYGLEIHCKNFMGVLDNGNNC